MPKIIETAVEDDANVYPLSHWQTRKTTHSNKFINRVDNVENLLMKPHSSGDFNIKWPKIDSNTNSAYRGQYNELTIEEKSDEGKNESSSGSDDGLNISIKALSGSGRNDKSARKSRKRKDSASGKSINSPASRSQKKMIVDETDSLTDSKILNRKKEDFVVIEEEAKEELELDQNEELAEQFKEKHAKLKKDTEKQVTFYKLILDKKYEARRDA